MNWVVPLWLLAALLIALAITLPNRQCPNWSYTHESLR